MSGSADEPAGAPQTVVVVGAGIVGVSTALWLQRSGHKVILIDRAEPGEGTSYGNGGVLASCSVVPVTVPSLPFKAPGMLLDPESPLFLKWSYVPRMLPWLLRYLSHCRPSETARIAAALEPIVGDSLNDHQALVTGTPAEKWLVPSDYLYVYADRAAYEGDAYGWNLRREHGFTWTELEGDQFSTYDPNFGDANRFAVCLPDHGHITDPGQYVKDIAAHVEANGGRILTAEVSDIAVENGKVTGVVAGGETIPCDAAVVTAGVWSTSLAKRLGIKVPMETERGYHVELIEPNIMPRAPVMVASGKYVATPMDGRIRLAGIVEFGGLDAPPSKKPVENLIKNIRAAMPGLTWKETRDWMGHRPAPSDSIPIIGAAPNVNGAYFGFGHHHIGLTGGPKTGRILADLIGGRIPNIDLAPYRPERFS